MFSRGGSPLEMGLIGNLGSRHLGSVQPEENHCCKYLYRVGVLY